MTAYAIYGFFYSQGAYAVDDIFALLLEARRLEPIGRFFRRVAAAVCAVMVADIAGSIGMVVSQNPLRLPRAGVYVSSIIASVLALAECILAARLANTEENPRLDDQFNTNVTVATLAAAAIIVLILGAMLVLLTAVKAARLASQNLDLAQVSHIALRSSPLFTCTDDGNDRRASSPWALPSPCSL